MQNFPFRTGLAASVFGLGQAVGFDEFLSRLERDGFRIKGRSFAFEPHDYPLKLVLEEIRHGIRYESKLWLGAIADD